MVLGLIYIELILEEYPIFIIYIRRLLVHSIILFTRLSLKLERRKGRIKEEIILLHLIIFFTLLASV